jgi:hypothetical protein
VKDCAENCQEKIVENSRFFSRAVVIDRHASIAALSIERVGDMVRLASRE